MEDKRDEGEYEKCKRGRENKGGGMLPVRRYWNTMRIGEGDGRRKEKMGREGVREEIG